VLVLNKNPLLYEVFSEDSSEQLLPKPNSPELLCATVVDRFRASMAPTDCAASFFGILIRNASGSKSSA